MESRIETEGGGVEVHYLLVCPAVDDWNNPCEAILIYDNANWNPTIRYELWQTQYSPYHCFDPSPTYLQRYIDGDLVKLPKPMHPLCEVYPEKGYIVKVVTETFIKRTLTRLEK